jgi:hypothetical protein
MVRYRLSFRQLIVASNVLMGVMAGMVWLDTRSPIILLLVPVGWLWLVGGNLAIGIPRFRRFLWNSIESVPTVRPNL